MGDDARPESVQAYCTAYCTEIVAFAWLPVPSTVIRKGTAPPASVPDGISAGGDKRLPLRVLQSRDGAVVQQEFDVREIGSLERDAVQRQAYVGPSAWQ